MANLPWVKAIWRTSSLSGSGGSVRTGGLRLARKFGQIRPNGVGVSSPGASARLAQIGRVGQPPPVTGDLVGVVAMEVEGVLSLAGAVVSNDSGLMHIAAALSRPLVVVYGATSPGFTPPLNRNAAVLASDIDCAPRFQRECPLQHHRCMREILPSQVAAKLDGLLQVEGH